MSDDSDGKKIGYKKPPQHSRWKPGHCGNPRGRPKGALNFATEVKSVLEAPVTVNENGRPKKISRVRATLLRLCEKALKGDVRSIALLLEYADRYGSHATDSPSDISEEDHAMLEAAFQRRIEREAAKDKSPDGDDEDKK